MKRCNRKRLMATALALAMVLSLCGVTVVPKKTALAATTLSNPTTDSNGVSTWDCIYFGNYYQSNSTTKEPIKWRVLSVNGNDAFLLADQNLDAQPYNEEYTSVTWETCTLRTWLNSTFLSTAFTSAEQAAIKSTTVVNDDNPYYDTEGGNDTTDQVYLLSIAEACNTAYGFNGVFWSDSETREAKNTAYAKERGAWTSTSTEYEGNGWWWLRSPGYNDCSAAYVGIHGYGDGDGDDVGNDSRAVRPALHLNLSSSTLWSYAGKVTSNGGGGESATPTATPAVTVAPTAAPDPESKYFNNIVNAMPDFSNLGSAELKGPEVSVGKHSFNIFKQSINMNLPITDSSYITVNYDKDEKTAEILIGLKPEKKASVKSDPNDKYWRKSYQEVKSLVKACGGKTDTTELWNRFSSLRGKLKKVNGSAAFSVKGNVAGYAKVKTDEMGNVTGFEEGGITAGMEAGGSVKVPLWWIVYSEFGVSGSVNGKFKLSLNSQKVLTPGGEFTLAVKPHVALGADAVVVDVKGGIQGEIAGKATFPWKSIQKSLSAYLTGKLYIKVDTAVPGLSGGSDWKFSKLELYPNLGEVKKSIKKFTYQRRNAVTYGEIRSIAGSENLISSAEDSIVYENAKPSVAVCRDGTVVMTYLDDTEESADGQTTLMYRTCQNGSWSEAKAVEATGRLDTSAKMISHDGEIYILYENSDEAITDDMSEEEILQHLTLKAAHFDTADKTFEDVVAVRKTESKWCYNYHFASDGTDLYAVWGENSEQDVLLEEGKTKIYRSRLSSDGWDTPEELYATGDTICDFAYGFVNGEAVLGIIEKEKLVVNGDVLAEGETGMNAVRVTDGKLYFIQDGILMCYDGEKTTSLNIACSSSYDIYEDTVYWIGQDNYYSEIYRQKIGEDGVSLAVTKDGGYIGGFALLKDADSSGLIYTMQEIDSSQENPYGTTVMKYQKKTEYTQAEVSNIAYDVLDFESGSQNPISVAVANTGTTDMENVKIIVKDASGNTLYEGAYADSIPAGTQTEQTILINVPNDFETSDLNIVIESGNEKISAKKTIEKIDADIAVTQKRSDVITVQNNGENTATVSLTVKDGGETGNVIHTEQLGTFLPGMTKDISLESVWKLATRNSDTGTKNLYVEVEQKETEYELWNNSICMEKEVPAEATPSSNVTPAPGTSSSATPAPVTNSVKVTAPAKVTLKSAKNKKGKKALAKWKKVSGAEGYQIQYAPNKKFKKKKSVFTKKTSYTIKKLKKKKTYFVRVRAYKKNGQKKVYGKWSAVKKVKIKK